MSFFNPDELRDAVKVPFEQAVMACQYTREQLAAANPRDLQLIIGGLLPWSERIVAHARIVTRYNAGKQTEGGG